MASDTRIVELEGELDMHRAPLLRTQLAPMIRTRPHTLALDLSRLNYVDSSGLALFIEIMTEVQGYGGRLVLFGLNDSVRHILEVARLDQVFTVFPDRASALAAA